MRAVKAHPDLQLITVLGASAVLDRFGNIEEQVRADGFNVDAKFYMIVEGENPVTMAKSTGLGIIELSMIFNNLRPDVVLVVGDRFDIMAPAIAASYMNIPIAHTMGGEVSGTIDESIRHAVTKMAHLHFPANELARERIIKMGEDTERVFNVGCPRIDLVKEILKGWREERKFDRENFFDRYKGVGGKFDIKDAAFLLVSYHPVTTEYGKNRRKVEEILYALNEMKMGTIMIWPNADAGSDEVSKGIRTFRERHRPEWLHVFVNLPVDIYIKLMAMCACMVGNSSSAVREGSYVGVPAVNIGTRQNGRDRGKNILDVNPDKCEILDAVRHQLSNGRYSGDYIYGDGNAGRRIADILARYDVQIQKRLSY
jgi:UDP-hydrolysing UDP-N-acetyl-D-glucosamine 2-epimerase